MTAYGGTEQQRAPEAIEGLVKQLLVTHKAVRIYPAASHIPRENAALVVVQLRELLSDLPTVRLTVARDGLFHAGRPVLPGQPAFAAFGREFYEHHLSDVRFHAGVTEDEVVGFLQVLQTEPKPAAAQGEFESRLWERHVDGITVTEVATTVVDAEGAVAPDVAREVWPPPGSDVSRMLDAVRALRASERRTLVRFLQDPALVASYLDEGVRSRGTDDAIAWLAESIAAMARLTSEELAEDAPSLSRSVAEGVMGLDPSLRGRLLTERLLSDARVDEAVADVVRQLDLEAVCDALAAGIAGESESRDGISRALRNLALISMAGRETIADAAHGALVAHGASAAEAASVIESAMPTRLVQSTAAESEGDVTSAVKLVDLAPGVTEQVEDDPALADLREEARAGVSDGDVLGVVVALLMHERRPAEFNGLMEIVEDSLGLLVEWGEYLAAAEAAVNLDVLSRDESLEPAQRARVGRALAGMADAARLRDVASAIRVFHAGSAEYESCRRLLHVLGEHTIAPLLEVLADEPEMTARRALVELISGVAERHLRVLGERVRDPRWFFVRNVVSILGNTKDPDVLPYLTWTLRHADERVRRETVRALVGVRDRRAVELLVAALSDSDAQNVQLAARYLGLLRVSESVSALVVVASGEGHGCREPACRIEAIEALGSIGGSAAMSALADLAGRRLLLRGGRAREMRAAAEAALAAAERGDGPAETELPTIPDLELGDEPEARDA